VFNSTHTRFNISDPTEQKSILMMHDLVAVKMNTVCWADNTEQTTDANSESSSPAALEFFWQKNIS
jgi:hypothetical protein